jgi:hypothetical protein
MHIRKKYRLQAPEGETALYRHFDKDGRLLYVGISVNVLQRTHEHRASHWWRKITDITIERYDSREAASAAESVAIEVEKPLYNNGKNCPVDQWKCAFELELEKPVKSAIAGALQ